MAGQKLKKQERYKEEQIKRRATHISTQETTTTEKYFLFTLQKFSNLQKEKRRRRNHPHQSIFPPKDDKGKQKHRARRAKGTPAGTTPKARHELVPKRHKIPPQKASCKAQ